MYVGLAMPPGGAVSEAASERGERDADAIVVCHVGGDLVVSSA